MALTGNQGGQALLFDIQAAAFARERTPPDSTESRKASPHSKAGWTLGEA